MFLPSDYFPNIITDCTASSGLLIVIPVTQVCQSTCYRDDFLLDRSLQKNKEIIDMITRHHLALALICTFIVCSFLIFSNPLIVAVIGTGACMGAILPDIHMSRPRQITFRTVAWFIVQFPRWLCVLVLDRIYACLRHPVLDPFDKRLTHSIPGVLFIVACTGVFLYLIATLINGESAGYMGIFLGGVFLGMGLHLAEDLCTRKGIFPFFPFSMMKISGSIRPCDQKDPRIMWYHIQGCIALVILLMLENFGMMLPDLAFPVSVAGLATCIGIMIYSSDVTISQDPGSTSRQVIPLTSQSEGRL
jgi:hypothetical protein